MKNTPVALRKELQPIPYGPSCTETEVAYYLRIREDSKIVTIRVLKGSLKVASVMKEKL